MEEAIRLGEMLGDSYVVPIDEVYRAEALIFEGIYDDALQKLKQLSEGHCPPKVCQMARSRLSFLAALTGQSTLADQSVSRYTEHARE